MPVTFKRIALCLNWVLAIVLGCLWYTQGTEPPHSSTSDQTVRHPDPAALARAARKKHDDLQAKTNGLLPIALKDTAYHEKLNRWLKLTRTHNEISLLRILNLPDDKREALIDLLTNRAIEGIDAQELASDDPATQMQMRHQVLSDYQSKITDLLGDKFWLYNQYVGLGEFRRYTLEPVGNLLEIYDTPLTREQQADLVDWFFSDNKRQRAPYESLATWADSDRSQLTAQQKQTLGPVLQEFSALNPPKTKKKNDKPATP